MIIFGERLYGKVDQVPGVFYVATRFLHIWFIPFAPSKSYLVVQDSQDSNRFTAYRIKASFKSIVIAWMRFLILLVFIGSAGLAWETGAQAWDEQKPEKRSGIWKGCAILGSAAVVSPVLLWSSYRFTRASPSKAVRLARQVGISPEPVVRFFGDRLRPEDIQALGLLPESGLELF